MSEQARWEKRDPDAPLFDHIPMRIDMDMWVYYPLHCPDCGIAWAYYVPVSPALPDDVREYALTGIALRVHERGDRCDDCADRWRRQESSAHRLT